MSRKSLFLALACLAAGSLLGYAAASGKLDVFEKFTRAAPPAEKEEGSCCSEGAGRSEFVSAQDDEKPKSGKKPNIVVIMGDDVGWFNIGAYHRGMMAGQDAEPRPARVAGHAVHRLLRRGELHGRAGPTSSPASYPSAPA